jgi:hypothetical protein
MAATDSSSTLLIGTVDEVESFSINPPFELNTPGGVSESSLGSEERWYVEWFCTVVDLSDMTWGPLTMLSVRDSSLSEEEQLG